MFQTHNPQPASRRDGTAASRDEIASRTSFVRLAQLQEILGFGSFAPLMNGFVTVFMVAVCYSGQGEQSPTVMIWGLINLVLVAARVIGQPWLATGVTIENAADRLLLLTGHAFLGGLWWAVLPQILPNFDVSGQHSYITLVVIGVSFGELARGVPYAPLALAFSLPPIMSLSLLLIESGAREATILFLVSLLFAAMLIRSCVLVARDFATHVLTRHEATALAASFRKANEDIKETNRALEVLANGDSLTGLANRSRFNTELEEAIRYAQPGEEVALFILDLDRFKFVNDTLGHAAGDELLVIVGKRLQESLEGAGLVARLGGDEFAVILSGLASSREALVVAESCMQRICGPVMLSNREFQVQASLGIAAFPSHAKTMEELFACADRALYTSKKTGRHEPVMFCGEMRRIGERQSRIELDITGALRSGELDVWFQPQVRLLDGEILGYEALIRWTHRELGAVSAREIVEAVNARRAHELLTSQVAEAACALLCELQSRGQPEQLVAINLSAQDLSLYDVPEALCAIAHRYGIDPSRIELEFTEDALLDPTVHGRQLQELDRMGFRLALDDFGMGSTSLNYLVSMRIDRLKIDRSFVHGVTSSRHSQALITAMVALGRMLDIHILVEGVETEDDRAMLRLLGCEQGQGYLFGRPMPVAQLFEWLETARRVA